MAFEACHQEVSDHPNERCVSSELTKNDIERPDRPLLLCIVPALEEGDIEGFWGVAAQCSYLWLKIFSFVRGERICQADEFYSIFVEPQVVKDRQ